LPIFALLHMSARIDDITISKGKKIYFASDFHLGVSSGYESLEREKKVVSWLSSIQESAAHIFILGDIFDFWFEYKYTIPKGFVRLLGKFMELRDLGIPITFFTGNHDMWMFHYFQDEFGIRVFYDPLTLKIQDKKFYIGHGDGLGPGDRKYKTIKKIFKNKTAQGVFNWIHPTLGIGLARYWSKKSRIKNSLKDQDFHAEREWLLQFCKELESIEHHDYYIFGHRHLPLNIQINEFSRYINIGDWLSSFTYAEYDGGEVHLCDYKK
jgi:UDP-2,3-diacylglucosamine hydrolase